MWILLVFSGKVKIGEQYIMLKRKITYSLVSWKNQENKKCLVVQGARQIGKTYAIEDFLKTNYEDFLEINFKETPSAVDIFRGNLDIATLITALRFRYPNIKFEPGKTAIFLDEIQECPEAITSLKFWSIDGKYDVICSGSLLGIDYNRASSYPVGYVEYLKMYSLDFEEFLWARGIDETLIGNISEYFEDRKPVPEVINTQLQQYLREYLAIGGMPEVVMTYVNSADFRQVDKIQRQLVEGYQYDIAHYASVDEKVKAEKCYLSLSRQLLEKENHKFQYKEVEQGGRAQKYFSSIEWLLKADIIKLCFNVSDIRYDLAVYSRSGIFRAYTTDLSLLIGMKDFDLKRQIIENSLAANTKGGLYECLIADILMKKGYDLYYYKNETTKKELEFLIQQGGQVLPIEVKSGKSGAASIKWVMGNKSTGGIAYKFIDGNVGVGENGVITMPHYMAMFL